VVSHLPYHRWDLGSPPRDHALVASQHFERLHCLKTLELFHLHAREFRMASFASREVTLNVYDLHTANGWLSRIGLGLYHSGVEVRR
jgi:hypothetical protein